MPLSFFKRWITPRAPAPAAAPEQAGMPAPVLFSHQALGLSAEHVARIREDVAERLPAAAQPSPAQWQMILSTTPTTCVVAGAGSGKSTSLVLRVLVLHHYLGFALDSMSVVTFTRESRNDFIKKVMQLFDLWGLTLSKSAATVLVRTFHSLVLPLARSLPGLAQLQAFETLGNEPGLANPFDLRLNDTQRQHLNQCYSQLLGQNPRFRSVIGQLRLQALQLKKLGRDHSDVRKRMAVTELSSRRDEELCDLIEDQWFRAGAWPIEGVEPQRKVVSINGSPFHCHGYIAELDAWIVLGVDPSEGREVTRSGSRLPVAAEWEVKRTLFQAFCDKPLIWIDNYDSGKRLWGALAGDAVAGPGFDYALRGDLGAAPLLDAFCTAAGFIENLGIDVKNISQNHDFIELNDDRKFFEALGLYWPALTQYLVDLPVPSMTYNSMFASFGESAHSYLASLHEDLLRPLTHLMVDEFQDVSPQIVSWLRACLGELQRRQAGQAHTSLLCVGDDWQSIYGWRGSSPHYFIEFEQTFPAPASTRVLLNDNFRSHQLIIDAAERLVRAVPSIPGKKALATATSRSGQAPVRVLARNDDDLANRVAQHLAHQHSILILYRRSADRSLIQSKIAHLGNPASVRLMTYHSAKGLQADAVFLVGDCTYASQSPYRNRVYRLAGLGALDVENPYDLAQRDEALRLAYVAITRAVRYCTWYVDEPGRAVAGIVRASDAIGGEGFVDERA